MSIEQKNILTVWAENTTDYNEPSETEIGDADNILPNKSIDAEPVNGALRIAFLAIQYLQRTGGLYNSTTPYLAGQSCSLIRKVGTVYYISTFVCLTGGTGNDPLTGATITTLNGVNIYTDGTVNSTYWKLNFPIVGTNWQSVLEDNLKSNMALALINSLGFGSSSFTLLSSGVYETLLHTGDIALFGTTATGIPDSSVSWVVQTTIVNGTTKHFLAFSGSLGIRFGVSTTGTITWSNVFSDLSVGNNWPSALNTNLNSNSALLLSTGINTDWLNIVTTEIANSITNSMLATMAENTIKGVITSGTPTDLTTEEVTAMLEEATESSQGVMNSSDKTKLNLYPDVPGENWNSAITNDLKSNMLAALSNTLGFGFGVGGFASVSTDVITTLLHAGDIGLFSSGTTNNPDAIQTWQIVCFFTGTSTLQGSKYIAFTSTSQSNIMFGVATSSSVITWYDIYNETSVSTNWPSALTTELSSNMKTAFSNVVGFGSNSFSLITTAVYTYLTHTGSIALFSSSATGVPDSSVSWIIWNVVTNNTTKEFIAFSTSKGCYFGYGTTTSITWKKISSEFDYYVINSSSSFQTLCDATSGSYPRVKVLSGTWTSTTPLNLTTTGIKEIVGEEGAVLNFNTTSGSILITGSSTEEIKKISITESSTVSTVSLIYAIKKIEDVILTVNTVNGIRYGFNSCGSIISTRIVLGGGSTSYNLYLFHACKRLSNIYISSSSDILTDGLYLFHESTDINNVTINLTAGFDNLYCFYDSNNVRNIDINLTSVSGSIAYVSYYNCENLSGIKCTFTGAGKFLGFSDNYNLSDITLDINSTYSTAEALKVFNLCENISNVKFIDFDVDYTTLYVFYYCKNISGIYINVMDVTTSATLYIFRSCQNINNIYSEATIVGDDIRFFYLSDTISNAYLNMSGSASTDFYCFYACEYISNCHINLTLSSGVLIGINDGALINNCAFVLYGLGTGSGSDIAGMLETNFISDCVLNIVASSGNISYVYGFSNCTQVRGCKVTMDDDTFYAFSGCHGLMGNWAAVGVFNASYSTIDSTGIAENTGGGGLNYTS